MVIYDGSFSDFRAQLQEKEGNCIHAVLVCTEDIDPDTAKCLQDLPSLECVLWKSPKVKEEGIGTIGRLAGVNKLCLETKQLAKGCLTLISEIQQLRWLVLRACQNVDDAVVSSFGGLPKLRFLDVAYSNITGVESEWPASIEQLVVDGSPITDHGLDSFIHIPRLQELSLNKTNISSAVLEQVKEFSCLHRLSMADCAINDRGVAEINKSRTIRTLDVSGTLLSDAGVSRIVRGTQLENLGVAGLEIGESTLLDMMNATALKWVDLRGATINLGVLARVKALRPDCEWLH